MGLIDEDGNELRLQIIERGLHAPQDARERVLFGFVAAEAPASGYKAMRVQYVEEVMKPVPPGMELTQLVTSGIENEYFYVEVESDGTLTVEDKRTGKLYRGLNQLVDSADCGDEYTYCPPPSDRFVRKPAGQVRVRDHESGPARHTLEARMTYSLPEGLIQGRTGRSANSVDCEIVTRVSLYPGVARIDIETEIDNRARDHRMRVHFPTGIVTDHVSAEQHFGIVERPIGVPEDDGKWYESPVATHPQKTFVDVSDGERGLMIANRGLPEYEALREADGTVTIALTLLRCVGWLSRHDLSTRKTGNAGPQMETPGAQMQGRWKFNYSLIPHASGWENAYAEAHRFVRLLRAIRVRGGDGSLPASGSLAEIEPATLVMSALKPAEDGDGIIVRVYNITDEAVQGSLRLNAAFRKVERVNLNEEEAEPLDAKDGRVELSLRPNEIVTLRFT